MGTGFIGLNAFHRPGCRHWPSAPRHPAPQPPKRGAATAAVSCRDVPASTLTSAENHQTQDAYAAMRALDTSDPSDPRGFTRQANIHCWFCTESSASVHVHFNWKFFAFHRAYLYFHERILGKLIGDMDFRLPYWDWDVSSHRKLPGAYTNPNNSSNPLFNSTRGMSPTDEFPQKTSMKT
jgi:polyphenol oxidase